jgi:hypothetical protein
MFYLCSMHDFSDRCEISFNLKACPVNSEHVYSCDVLVQFLVACAVSNLVVNIPAVTEYRPSHIRREFGRSKNRCFVES